MTTHNPFTRPLVRASFAISCFALTASVSLALPQELDVETLDQRVPDLKAVFEHQFSDHRPNDEYFVASASFLAGMKPRRDGIFTSTTANGPWSSDDLSARIEIHGDFDVEARFDEFQAGGEDYSVIMLNVNFSDKLQQVCRMMRLRDMQQRDKVQTQISELHEGKRKYTTMQSSGSSVTSGRLRLSRRGADVYYLVAEGDSDVFRIIGQKTATAEKTTVTGITLETNCNGTSSVGVLWKSVRIRAERLVTPRHAVETLDRRLPQLTSVFEHDFTADGLPTEYFTGSDAHLAKMREQSDGIFSGITAAGNWAGLDLLPRFELHGDFDIEARFDQLELTGDNTSCIMLTAELDDDPQHICRAVRMHTVLQKQILQASLSEIVDGKRVYDQNDATDSQALSGRLRLARRGHKVTYLFADGDSDDFRVIGTRIVTDSKTKPQGVKLRTLCNGNSYAGVVWKHITIRAEKMFFRSPEDSFRKLAVINPDGTGVRILTGPPEFFTHLGSPEWSADGKRITFDASLGDTDTSHIFVANADGSDMEDLGPGCMPSFSADGTEIVFTESGFGIIRMDADGRGRHRIEESGWGTQFAPTDSYIAWAEGKNITLLHTDSEERRNLLTNAEGSSVGRVYWNFSWSNDSKFIAFKCRSNSIAVKKLDSTKENFDVIFSGSDVGEDISWHPDGRRILFSMLDPKLKRRRLFTVDRITKGRPQPLPDPPAGWQIFDCDWSPDGSRILFSGIAPSEPVDWSIRESDGR